VVGSQRVKALVHKESRRWLYTDESQRLKALVHKGWLVHKE